MALTLVHSVPPVDLPAKRAAVFEVSSGTFTITVFDGWEVVHEAQLEGVTHEQARAVGDVLELS